MNRVTVILLALAILLAHTFAIHQTPDGDFAETYDIAHVAYRLGRNLAYEGAAVWNPGGAPTESYPSATWVLVSALAQRLYLSPIGVSQVLGLLSALVTIVALAQFSPKRASGMIAPVLLAASGSTAAAALSGTEATLTMMLVTVAFLAFERGWRRVLAITLALLIPTRPEGGVVLLAVLAFEALWRPRGEHGRRPPRWLAFVLPALVALGTTLVRHELTGQWLSPLAAPLLEFAPARWTVGREYLESFAVSSGFGLLFLVVIFSTFAGRVSAMGARALVLVAAWWGIVVLSGGDELPFWSALVPVLPLFFLGVQDCMRAWMDEREGLARIVWPVLGVSIGAALLVSKIPGDFGPLRLEEPLTRWQTPRGELAKAYPRPLGRLGLLEEIRAVEHLRTLGVFLRDRVGADARIMTAWPGAIGYLSRREVLDLTGRAWPLPGSERPFSWRGVSRVDVVAALDQPVDYIVPLIGSLSEREAPTDFLVDWLERYDTVGASDRRRREVLRALNEFMLISVPVPARSRNPREPSEHPFPLLRRKELEMIPVLSLDLDAGDGTLRVLAHHEGHQQVVDLTVRATSESSEDWYLAPTGVWKPGTPLDARTSLVIFPTGSRSIQLIRAEIPGELRGARITARLHNPGMRPDAPLAAVGTPVTREAVLR